MLKFLLLAAGYWIWSVAWFAVIQKPLFMLANRRGVALKEIWGVYRHGFVSDAIIASYLTAVPLLAGVVQAMTGGAWLAPTLTVYDILTGLTVGLVATGDAVLYRFWNSKVDASVFGYMRSVRGATASVSGLFIAGWFLVWVAVSATYFAGCEAVNGVYAKLGEPGGALPWWGYAAVTLAGLAAVAVLAVVIRGLKIRPNNPSVVYFSSKPFLNHAALNPGYSLIYSLGTQNEFGDQFREFSDDECERIMGPLYPRSGHTMKKLLRTDRPNIVTVVWESYGAEFCGALWGREEVTPNFNALAREGVLFTNCRASSFRTDRALPSIFCGLPGQPTTSVVRHTRKLPELPAWPRRLRELGYETAVLHGGELTIMHKSDFYLASGHTRLIAQKDFPSGLDKGKWGVHDVPAMERAVAEAKKLNATGRPWALTVQTLSSHEPFTVPYHRLEDAADNSMAYTDESLGVLVRGLKDAGLWDDLLLIVVADHGLNRSSTELSRSEYCHIPLLFAGGAVRGAERIDTLMSQPDLAATLLGQLGLGHEEYPFSRDVLADSYREATGLHTYGNGFLFTDSTGTTDYDNIAGHATEGADAAREARGKAILQRLYEYLGRLG
ncbi:MAG: sulfatase-like hydrolase/transferase [Bacteroides sp.]|nr:sulfatase-like hydrolase/transferase [Bacteroides sp.]